MWSQNAIYYDCKLTKKAMFYKHLSCEVIRDKASQYLYNVAGKNKEEKPINHQIETRNMGGFL